MKDQNDLQKMFHFLPAVKYLIEECGAEVDPKDGSGSSPLIYAARFNHMEIVLLSFELFYFILF